MIKDFILPDIGEGIVECELVEWLVKEGDTITEDQPVADVSTDKALVQIPSMFDGRVVKLYYKEGEIAKVHEPLFAIELADEVGSNNDAHATKAAATTEPAATTTAPATAVATVKQESSDRQMERSTSKALTTPAVRRIARENNVDLAQVPASGKNGRILKEDMLNFLSGDAPVATAPAASTAAPVVAGDRVEPIKGIKAVMARAMQESVSTIPHFTYVDEIDLTDLIALRLKLKAQYPDVKITMMPLFMKALSLAISEFPIMNSRPNADCTELTYVSSHNIGMAVDSKVGLLVPNVKNVQTMNLLEVAGAIGRLTESARAGRVAPEDLKGGTITISNVGALGGTVATPIINKPEVAIVALGKVQALPRFNEKGEVEARQIMTVSWSGDHRIIDGGTIARFCNRWKQFLEDPSSMLVTMR
ncbi:2-oxo acid dehydrogenase subunit E2 [Simiduia agarivorans]|uniref:Dihydrolipoamide acetyltransferase component of pyruvate dehydrogenase complex n=1 Tax=Simiduia agarivorans (strain DSM 21679 / JCM 13881 / BCRC 17597 / SA1) TaxID=1117647 RepID=K4KPZ1_SIMAS|nr:2-oxo acid dehydrogenase subunit E2 [Simiduia agarivorans]AFV00326.1 dihydrolipoamide acetyltransferase [Simiduia agarivorans SA1 = DSM 21679]